MPWIHPVCAHVICNQCQSSDMKHGLDRPCPNSLCLYHHDQDRATRLCPWPALHPHGSRIPALALPIWMSQQSIPPLLEQKTVDPSGNIDYTTPTSTSTSTAHPALTEEKGSTQGTSQHLYEICGNCHKQGESHRIMALDLECLIGMCLFCFGYPDEVHEDHMQDMVVRLKGRPRVKDELLEMLTATLTPPVERRIESAAYSDYAVRTAHQRGDVSAVEGMPLGLTVDPITQSFFDRMARIRSCGYALLSIYNDLQQAYHGLMTTMKREGRERATGSPSTSSTDAECKSDPNGNKLIQFLENEGGEDTLKQIISRLEGMVAQRMILIDSLDCVVKLLGLPTSLLNQDGGCKIGGKDERTEVIQYYFEALDMSTPQDAAKAVIIVRTFMGIRGVIDSDDISLGLDLYGLEVLGLKEEMNEVIMACQNICKQLQSPKGEEVETVATNFLQVCDKVNKLLTIEAVYSAMETAYNRVGGEDHVKEGMQYMFSEESYDGARALAAFGLAISKGSKEAMFRKAQLLFDWRAGVDRNVDKALKLFTELREQDLYLPQIFYYLSKHVLEKSLGRTAETYGLVSRYFTDIIEMKYDDDEEEVERKVGDGGKEVDDDSKVKDRGDEGKEKAKGSTANKAAVLFAQAGVYFIYAFMDKELQPYFRRQLPPSVRHWLRECDFLKLCLQAKEAGCKEPELYLMLGYAQYLNHKDEDEFKEAIANLDHATTLGIIAAYHILGRIYSPELKKRSGYSKDPKKAMDYYSLAVPSGYNCGGRFYTDIACLYRYREDGEMDGMKVLKYLDYAISRGDECAYDMKAIVYEVESLPCPPIAQSDEAAHKLRLLAVAAGCKHPSIYERIGDDYTLGRGVDKDGEKAVIYLEQSIEYGKTRMYQWLARLYDTKANLNLPNIAQDDLRAFQYYLKEAEMIKDEDGFDLGPCERWLDAVIGAMYVEGRGTSMDHNKAVEYYNKAIEGYKRVGDRDALNRLGALYDTSRGDKPYPYKDDQEARKYYKAAMELDSSDKVNKDALLRLGNMYRDGVGGEVDGTKAIQCYDKALSVGGIGALYDKAVIFDPEKKMCPPIEKDERRAALLYLAAVGAGFKEKQALLTLVDCFEKGRGVKKDEEKARSYASQAANVNYR